MKNNDGNIHGSSSTSRMHDKRGYYMKLAACFARKFFVIFLLVVACCLRTFKLGSSMRGGASLLQTIVRWEESFQSSTSNTRGLSHPLPQTTTGALQRDTGKLVEQTGQSCFYRAYPDPALNSGLPFLADVFSSDGAVYFVGVNKGGAETRWIGRQEFHSRSSGDASSNSQHFFKCHFPSHNLTTRSDPVHRKFPGEVSWTNAIMVIRCPIPLLLQTLVPPPQSPFTSFTVTLQATENLLNASDLVNRPENEYSYLPVCHREWPSTRSSSSSGQQVVEPTTKNKKGATTISSSPQQADAASPRYNLTLMTRLRTLYPVSQVKGRISVPRSYFTSWVDHHLALGIEHIYIYDSEPAPHSILESWCAAYGRDKVTYIWFPYPDAIREPQHPIVKETYRGETNVWLCLGQYAAGNSALRRYAHQTKYMGAWDIDEFLVLPTKKDDDAGTMVNLQDWVEGHIQENKYDNLQIPLRQFGPCGGATNRDRPSAEGTILMEAWKCSRKDTTNPKPLMRTDAILYFLVHETITTTEDKTPKRKVLDATKDGAYLAHFRLRETAGSFEKRSDDVFSNATIRFLRDKYQAHGHAMMTL